MSTSKQVTINGEVFIPAASLPAERTEDFVVVRCKDAGTHAGHLVYQDGRTVELKNAHRIWRWRGARTLSEVANNGIMSAEESGYTRVAEMVPSITVLDACEVIPATEAARQSIISAGWSD